MSDKKHCPNCGLPMLLRHLDGLEYAAACRNGHGWSFTINPDDPNSADGTSIMAFQCDDNGEDARQIRASLNPGQELARSMTGMPPAGRPPREAQYHPRRIPQKKRRGWQHRKRVEAVGEKAWELAVALKVFRETLPLIQRERWQTNEFMAACAIRLGLATETGAAFEMHIAGVYQASGLEAVAALAEQFCR